MSMRSSVTPEVSLASVICRTNRVRTERLEFHHQLNNSKKVLHYNLLGANAGALTTASAIQLIGPVLTVTLAGAVIAQQGIGT